ncbi:MAG: glycosyltransferase family 2 protein [Bacteroidota bacterium]
MTEYRTANSPGHVPFELKDLGCDCEGPLTVAVVILNWNGKEHLRRFLPSVIEHTPNARIILADNAGTDDSIPFVKEHFPTVDIIALPHNYGYAGGYNRALANLDEDIAVLLNSDVQVTDNWLLPLLEVFARNPKAAAVQPKIRSLNEPAYFEYAGAAGGMIDYYGFPFCRGRIFDTLETDSGQYNDTTEVAWASGACLAVRLTTYRILGGFDDYFFAHMEEIDLCWRMRNRGYSVWACGNSHVFHLGGGTLHKSNPKKTYLNFRNGLYMLYRNSPAKGLFARMFIRLSLDGIAGLRFAMQGNFKDLWAILSAHYSFYMKLQHYTHLRHDDAMNGAVYSGKHIFPGSVVWAYFKNKVKTYTELMKQA